jgi:uncharacterized tellurite resistance protein B-like protein
MRAYRQDSPEAAARIVALALIADGHFSRDELEALDRGEARERLNITPERLHDVVRGLCEDLMMAGDFCWSGSSALDDTSLASMLDEVRHPLLRMDVLQLCIVACTADGRLEEAENRIIRAAVARWGLCGAPGHRHGTERPCLN